MAEFRMKKIVNLNIHVHLEYTDKNNKYEILYTNLSTL